MRIILTLMRTRIILTLMRMRIILTWGLSLSTQHRANFFLFFFSAKKPPNTYVSGGVCESIKKTDPLQVLLKTDCLQVLIKNVGSANSVMSTLA